MNLNQKDVMNPRPQCFCCKSPLYIYRNENNDNIVYFDGHYYHRDCFMTMNKIIKKCCVCKEDIECKSNDTETIYYDKHFYHKSCFIDWCHGTKRKSTKREFALLNTERYVSEANQEIDQLLSQRKCTKDDMKTIMETTKLQIKQWFDRSDLCRFIREEYDVKSFRWDKLSKVLNGGYKDFDGVIPAEHLLDMWKRKLGFIRKQNERLISRSGKQIEKDSLINYDLAILVNKYDSYLKWREEQKILEVKENVMPVIATDIIKAKASEGTKCQLNDDMSDLVDDIFDD